MEKQRHTNRKRKRRISKYILLILFVLLIGAGSFFFLTARDVKQTIDSIQKDSAVIDEGVTSEKIKNKERINILLLGIDEREFDSGRSDAMLLMSLDPNTESLDLVSIPRDTRTEIVGHHTIDKINHAYAFGGVDMAVETVEELLNTDIDYFVEINMQGLADLVDAVDGVTVNNDLDWYDEGFYKKDYHYKKGQINLNGDQALGYTRMRHLDPDGDFGRNSRQRQVIEAILNKGANIKSVSKIDDLLDVLGKNVQTNINLASMRHLFTDYRNVRNSIQEHEIRGQGTKIDGIYYLIVPEDEIAAVHKSISK
ncbi:transcriptional attenuator, LytR family [Terribacillus aidingensis]|uniref:Transcriptional attenuator, LytR family n=1 Tax=Terribacillus aidingensis TaxID=586416 RepID=A0A285N4H6_9BACI|nr:LCP family protein [Terribacillus aidingensis]SNZ02631.1 transcriptional attenuator, LytR family [Terribacillus aidingensis]